MSFFNIFKTNKVQTSDLIPNRLGQLTDVNVQEIPEDLFIQKQLSNDDNRSNSQISVEDPINNIEYLYRFLDRNLEPKGYDDALINPDSFHLEQNIEAQRMELMRTIKKVKTFYEDFIREIDYHIASRAKSGMVDTVEELKMKKSTAISHIEKVTQIESDASNHTGDCQGIIISYTKGFKNGLAAISHHSIISKKF